MEGKLLSSGSESAGRNLEAGRRIVAGKGRKGDVRSSGEYYYTDDHYRSFRRIRER